MLKYIKRYKDFLNESIYVPKGIKQLHVPETQGNVKAKLLEVLRIPEESMAFLGSAGKLSESDALSYNINIGVDKKSILDENNIPKEELFEFIQNQLKRIKIESVVNEDRNEVVFDYPISGDEDNTIEIKMKLTENLNWLKFSRHSPIQKKESKYTSKYREAYLASIVECAKMDILGYYNDRYLIKEFEEYHYDAEDGLYTIQKTFEGKNGLLKKAISLKDAKKLVTNKPEEFIEKIFGEGVTQENLATFESIDQLVKSPEFKYPKKRKKIYEKLKHKLINLRLEVPKDLGK